MSADWQKIKHAYVTGNIGLRDLAKKYSVPFSDVSKHSSREEWVRLRDDYRVAKDAKAVQKTLEKVTDQQAEQAAKIKSVTDKLLDAVVQAAAELNVTELRQRKQVKKTEEKGKGVKEEQTITKEYLERTESAVDMQRVQNITTALRNILEIDTMLSGGNLEENQAFDDLMHLIGGSNETN